MSPILREIARLRHRVLRVEILRSLLDAATVGLLLGGGALLVAYLLERPLQLGAAAGGALLLLCLVAGVLRGFRTGRRSDLFLAKWLDLENGLEDRFASSYDFAASDDRNEFSRACVQTTLALLARRTAPLQLPRLRLGDAWWRPLAATSAIVAGALLALLARPTSAPGTDGQRVAQIPAGAMRDLEQATEELAARGKPGLDRVRLELVNLIAGLDGPSATRAEVLGQMTQAEQSLKTAERALAAGSASAGEKAVDPAAPGKSPAARNPATPGKPGAGPSRAGAEQRTGEAIRTTLERLRAVKAWARGEPGPGEADETSPGGRGSGRPPRPDTDGEIDEAVRRGVGTTPATGPLEHVSGIWNGKTLQQLVDASQAGGAGDQAQLRRLVAVYAEVARQEVGREQIPAAYSRAVRRYFDQVQRRAEH